MAENELLKAVNISKSYAGIHALRDASFELHAGEVHALVGENGAGKSTLIKIITGAVLQDDGEIILNGEPVTENSPAVSKSLGIAAIYQQPALFPELTVAENIAIGQERAGAFGVVKWKERRRTARELLDRVGAKIDLETTAAELSMPQQQLVEIARALGVNAKILILDEPTASLSEEDTQNLFRVIRELRTKGVGIIYISHRLEELQAIADRVTVLRDGRTIDTREMASVSREQLIRLMVGRDLSAVFPKRAVELGETIFELRNFGSSVAGIRRINLAVRAGEIVGVAGLIGAGRTELATTIFGLKAPDEGDILLKGKTIRIGHPCEAIEYGIAYLPEDRRKHGVVLDFPISANITLASLKKLSGFGGINFGFGKEKEIAAEYTRRLGVKTPAIYNAVSTLSGGNQQKVALSRWLMTKPSVLILDEPTQGIDVGAKAEIHELMVELAEQGVAILMISSELPEVLGMSDRIAVMYGGTIAKIFDREDATQAKILSVALGHLESVTPAT
ncbi:MAG TPA: sugar ABC transporter ATP-binding protein [Pyrinomonadaceae bacterium]|nr:sugar ABC transporter ATP-binding protein [Pyrinomonadaceae bacterium]